MRRTGKTSLFQLIAREIRADNRLFLDFENPLHKKYFEGDYDHIRHNLELLGLDLTRPSCIFLDEIQLVKNIPSVVKYLMDHYRIKFFLTGSASFYLKNLFSESLAGRKYIFELFPLSFNEFLRFKKLSYKVPSPLVTIDQITYDTLSPLYEEYCMFGGFPQVVLKTSVAEKKKSLEDIFTSFYRMEIVQLGDFRRNETIRDLTLLLLQRIGAKLDVQKISRETGISRPTLHNYLAFLEGTYFISAIKPFSRGRDTEIRKMPKLYVCDSGIANHFARLDPGTLFEQNVFQALRLRGSLHYYQKKSGAEIDFILNKEKAYEVKTTPGESDGRKLKILAKELHLKECAIVSRNLSTLSNLVYGFQL